ncbi:SulP family inorganic anion transporter [Streptomyces ipomoeae]|uniref:Inorganic anion transporter, SulP family n=1 Tax=Streptomyces ipomoeae 91-03 TaxID=698759 RepID=L1KW90_9ACTN|nr:SulP family inorganic anion transporter [Streptomyces ipomoeae]EKX64877.1 inorganic anion transporter, SulP family [Streptomyces ipomoeae 91-03]MDX2700021.1 SulP family inorganic anion transporter [Streptomyces ipomoeae]MDX2827612.1 SulP family inorganic anion transporter [Streptomyces ipomoeae]MDX2843521.1 SulP family inorganic anion transporter [Streptomyces ipomoeae]MDX2880079.1 SulP family inorganic anion transporter [Streptomyces ipomoeae]
MTATQTKSTRPHTKFPYLRQDFAASLVVFLVALPLCVGVAVASGVPAELGLVTGIVGGIVAGLLPGSSLQVSGPAAGLTVLVFEAVSQFGLPALGVIVLAAGLLQLAMGALKLGRWFRAISVSVVEGMLAGIGLVIIAGQLYAAAGLKAPASGLDKIAGLPGAFVDVMASTTALVSLALGAGTVAVLVLWKRLPKKVQVVPGALAAVLLATVASLTLSLPVANVEVQGLLESIQPPSLGAFGDLADVAMIGTILAFTLIASAESLFSAAAVDRLHDGPRTEYDKELMAQGAGNTVCGLLGALPMTAVIVRSSANVQAGARTKASRVLHGVWLLLFAALLPGALALIPLPALAGILVHAGWKLIPFREVVSLWRAHRGEALILMTTALAIVAVNMFEGVLIGLALSVAKTAWEASHIKLEVIDKGAGPIQAYLSGNATFLRLPKILDSLESLPQDRPIELHLSGLHHLDHACRTALETWAERHSATGTEPVKMTGPEPATVSSTTP